VPMKHIPVPKLLPKPEGDPEAMDEMAAACRQGATQIATAAEASLKSVTAMAFRAPAASRVRGRIRGNSLGNMHTADALRSFAKHLEAGATELRTAIAAYDRSVEAQRAAREHNGYVDEFNWGETAPYGDGPRFV
jgi:hypothetical protein